MFNRNIMKLWEYFLYAKKTLFEFIYTVIQQDELLNKVVIFDMGLSD